MIRARGLQVGYGGDPVVHGVDLDVATGRIVGLLGPNGSGKTTVLRTLHGSLRPSAGTVHLDGTDIASLSTLEVARRIAVVVQEPEQDSDQPVTAADVVLLGRIPHRGGRRAAGHDEMVAADALHRVGALHLARRGFAGLSGGEKQRVLLARGVAQAAGHLLLDEPTNHLDVRYQHEVLDLVRRLGSTVVVVLHDLNLAAQYCDEVVLLRNGQVAAGGTPQAVLTPEVVEDVYEVDVRRVELADGFQLAFRHRVRS